MAELIKLINIAMGNKPPMGDACNHCGYCCLMEICAVGQDLTGKTTGRCELLVEKDGKYFCSLGDKGKADSDVMHDTMGFGVGCCAETQKERIDRLMGVTKS